MLSHQINILVILKHLVRTDYIWVIEFSQDFKLLLYAVYRLVFFMQLIFIEYSY
jgi:hypothetical protein